MTSVSTSCEVCGHIPLSPLFIKTAPNMKSARSADSSVFIPNPHLKS